MEDKHLARFDGKLGVDFQAMEDIYLRSENIEQGTESSHGKMSDI